MNRIINKIKCWFGYHSWALDIFDRYRHKIYNNALCENCLERNPSTLKKIKSLRTIDL